MKSIIKEDYEFYKKPNGKIGVDKVLQTTRRSGRIMHGDTSLDQARSFAKKRIPFDQMSADDKQVARTAFNELKDNGTLNKVAKEFNTSPRADVVLKASGDAADVYYDDNKTGMPDEKIDLTESRSRLFDKLLDESAAKTVFLEDFYKFDDIVKKYMAPSGEGDTKASQIAAAVNKIIYKWFNDGDVVDNVHTGLSEGVVGNDLSSYANWLWDNVGQANKPLVHILNNVDGNEDKYAVCLYELASKLLKDDVLSFYSEQDAVDSIYDYDDGPFEVREDKDDDPEW